MDFLFKNPMSGRVVLPWTSILWVLTALQMGSHKKQKQRKDTAGLIPLSLTCTCQTIKTVMNYKLLYKILLSEAKFKFVLIKVNPQIFSLRKKSFLFLVFDQERRKISCWIHRFNFYWIILRSYHRKYFSAKLTKGYLFEKCL